MFEILWMCYDVRQVPKSPKWSIS